MLAHFPVHISWGSGKVREHRRNRSAAKENGCLGHTVRAVISWRDGNEICARGVDLCPDECCLSTKHLPRHATLQQIDLPDSSDLWRGWADAPQSFPFRPFR